MPVDGLYLAGSGAHPGGGVTGAPGRNAAREVIADRSTSSGVSPQVFEPLRAPAVSRMTLIALSRRTCFATTSAMYALRPRGPATSSTSARTSSGMVMFVRTSAIVCT